MASSKIVPQSNKFDGIYLGRRKGRTLVYAGKVENGFSADAQKDLREQAESIKADAQPLSPKVRKPKAIWLKPRLLAEIEYRALAGEGKVRHPSFKGLRIAP
jgi:bifunctional non-homologous end joining protein LigD